MKQNRPCHIIPLVMGVSMIPDIHPFRLDIESGIRKGEFPTFKLNYCSLWHGLRWHHFG